MTDKAIQPARLDDLAAMVDLSIKEANKSGISAQLLSIRESVMSIANPLQIGDPPALQFDPR